MKFIKFVKLFASPCYILYILNTSKQQQIQYLFSVILVLGEEPYPTIRTPADLIACLSLGFRMARPEHCSDEL